MKSLLLSLVIAPAAVSLSSAVWAEEASTWSLGLGLSVAQSPYAGADTSVTPLPLLNYESERLFFHGLMGGVHLFEQQGFGLDVIVAGRLDGIDRDDFGRRELARNGIDRDLLDDRDDGLDVGLRATWKGTPGEVQALAKGDVSGASNGYELSLRYSYPLQLGATRVEPGVAVSYLSGQLADYYFGTSNDEVARGVPRYRPGSAVVPSLGVGVSRALGERWLLNGELGYRFLPDRISDSPLVDEGSGSLGVKVGLSWRF
ncbi:MipA/OmpV family protein [Phytopseudomonas dryadis]|uniref:MipA/OmpV family protein n=1 Tax=Phytopseudomonas dryadis TaxID=2487520 RepID=A0ABY1YZZ2_9GAMM|nr:MULTISPECIES: MipA/OmpV family protein [Pseudomonas]TBV00284.1 MipA/OmpV family protein [Pseudomonas dryadis]TBV12831.1 MipA/OmpV family protein [Pseudomonas sp. FRB 230]